MGIRPATCPPVLLETLDSQPISNEPSSDETDVGEQEDGYNSTVNSDNSAADLLVLEQMTVDWYRVCSNAYIYCMLSVINNVIMSTYVCWHVRICKNACNIATVFVYTILANHKMVNDFENNSLVNPKVCHHLE